MDSKPAPQHAAGAPAAVISVAAVILGISCSTLSPKFLPQQFEKTRLFFGKSITPVNPGGLLSSEISLEQYPCRYPRDMPRQTNSVDCGVFVLAFADYLARDAELTFTQMDINSFRATLTDAARNLKVATLPFRLNRPLVASVESCCPTKSRKVGWICVLPCQSNEST
jgi:hypothetical protein